MHAACNRDFRFHPRRVDRVVRRVLCDVQVHFGSRDGGLRLVNLTRASLACFEHVGLVRHAKIVHFKRESVGCRYRLRTELRCRACLQLALVIERGATLFLRTVLVKQLLLAAVS